MKHTFADHHDLACESSHIIAVATIMEKEDDYTLICDIQGLGSNVLVKFEEKVSVEIGASLRIKGNLKAALDD